MPELRKDYLVDEYVVVATERGKRPDQFKTAPEAPSQQENCPFCPEHEYMLPAVFDEIKENGLWIARAVPNKFTIVEPKGNPIIQTDNTFFTYASAYGFHEIIIESRSHTEELEQQSPERIAKVMKLAISRINAHVNSPNIRTIVLFKNRGRFAGASINHSHMQLITYNHMPPFLKEQLESYYDYFIKKESCPYCEIMHIEKNSFRHILENEHWIVFTPYASRFPFEVWLFPKRHMSAMTQLNDDELLTFSAALKKILLRLDTLGNPSFNIQFLMADVTEPYHFHVRVIPRLSTWGGFEFDTFTIVNPISPEEAAKFYREE